MGYYPSFIKDKPISGVDTTSISVSRNLGSWTASMIPLPIDTNTNGSACCRFERSRQPWLQWPWDSGVPDPERTKQSEKQAYSPKLQKSRLWPLQIGRVPWDKASGGRTQEIWSIFKDHLCQAQECWKQKWQKTCMHELAKLKHKM